LGTIDDATFAADAPPAASADLVSQRFDHRDGQPGRLVFGRQRIAATDTSNPNHEPHYPAAPTAHSPQAQRSAVDGFRLALYGLKERSCMRRW
jgi:hypothetical protein